MPDGGPDGGDGGRGGDVIFVVDDGLNTPTDYRHRRKFVIEPGQEGGKKTVMEKWSRSSIKSSRRNYNKGCRDRKVIADMSADNRRQIVPKGGRSETSILQLPQWLLNTQPGWWMH